MAKKNQKPEVSVQLPVVENHLAAESEVPYAVGVWANLPQYVCKKCGYDSLDADAMQEHLFWSHSLIVDVNPTPLSASTLTAPQIGENDLEGIENEKGE